LSGPDHSALLGKTNRELRMIAGDATHQHYKGGLYRLLGPHRDSETGEEVKAPDGSAWLIYEHVYPHKRELWRRPASEFYEDVRVKGKTVPRFRQLG
jgi:hypothetical protein